MSIDEAEYVKVQTIGYLDASVLALREVITNLRSIRDDRGAIGAPIVEGYAAMKLLLDELRSEISLESSGCQQSQKR